MNSLLLTLNLQEDTILLNQGVLHCYLTLPPEPGSLLLLL